MFTRSRFWRSRALDARPRGRHVGPYVIRHFCVTFFDRIRSCSFSLTTFSPSGKLVQIEYALQAVNSGATSLGIKASNGVVLATEKKLPSILVDDSTVRKISLVTPSIGMTYAGMGPDSRVLVRKARKCGQVYYRQYAEQISVAQLVRETATVMQEFTRTLVFGLFIGSLVCFFVCFFACLPVGYHAHFLTMLWPPKTR